MPMNFQYGYGYYNQMPTPFNGMNNINNINTINNGYNNNTPYIYNNAYNIPPNNSNNVLNGYPIPYDNTISPAKQLIPPNITALKQKSIELKEEETIGYYSDDDSTEIPPLPATKNSVNNNINSGVASSKTSTNIATSIDNNINPNKNEGNITGDIINSTTTPTEIRKELTTTETHFREYFLRKFDGFKSSKILYYNNIVKNECNDIDTLITLDEYGLKNVININIIHLKAFFR